MAFAIAWVFREHVSNRLLTVPFDGSLYVRKVLHQSFFGRAFEEHTRRCPHQLGDKRLRSDLESHRKLAKTILVRQKTRLS